MPEDLLDLDELYAWIDTVPLSRPKRNISRDFADGVMVAELVAHFLPKIVDLHNYPAASSLSQRKINWQTLNRKVLVKIGVRIGEDTIQQLVDAKSGIIEHVLVQIRHKLELFGVGKPELPRIQYQSPSQTSQSPIHPLSHTGSRLTVIRMDTSSPQNSGVNSPRVKNSNSGAGNKISVQHMQPRLLAQPLKDEFKYNYANDAANANENIGNRCGNDNHNESSIYPESPNPVGLTPTVVGQINRAHHVQGYVASPATPLQASRGSLRSASSRGSGVKTAVSEKLDEAPTQIIYRGHKMIPLQYLDEKEKETKCLETTNRNLTLKIFRLETLVNIKDQRVEDLTHQLQTLRSMYERVTDKTLQGIGK